MVAVGSLNMHGGKCPRSPPFNPPSSNLSDTLAFSSASERHPSVHAIILAHLRTLQSGVGRYDCLIFVPPILPLVASHRDFRITFNPLRAHDIIIFDWNVENIESTTYYKLSPSWLLRNFISPRIYISRYDIYSHLVCNENYIVGRNETY